MELIDLTTGYVLAAFADFMSAKGYAEERQRQGARVTYCGRVDFVRPMEVKRWARRIPGKGFMDYRYREEDYSVALHGLKRPPTFGNAQESIRTAAELLGRRQGFAPLHIVVENRG